MTRFSTLSLLVAASLVTASVAPTFAQTAPAPTPPAATAPAATPPAATPMKPAKPLTAEGQKRLDCNAKWRTEKAKTKAKGWKPYFVFMAQCM